MHSRHITRIRSLPNSHTIDINGRTLAASSKREGQHVKKVKRRYDVLLSLPYLATVLGVWLSGLLRGGAKAAVQNLELRDY